MKKSKFNQNSQILILGGGELQLPLIEAAKAKAKTIVFDAREDCPGSKIADAFYKADISQADEVLRTIEEHNLTPMLAATSGTDFSDTVAGINARYALPGIQPPQAKVLTDKILMRKHFARHGFAQPAYSTGQTKEDLYQWIEQNPSDHGYVIKPARNMGARGVLYLARAEQLSYAYEYAKRYDRSGRVILEHYVPALELSVDALVLDGEVFLTGVADRVIEIKDKHYFIETGHNMPTARGKDTHEQIHNLFTRIAQSLKEGKKPYRGALKGDLRLNDSGEMIIGEIAGRLSGGFMSTHTYPAATGVNLMETFLDLLTGKKPDIKESHKQYSGISIERSVTAPEGILHRADFELNLPRGITEIHRQVNAGAGDTIDELDSNVGKLAHFVFRGQSLSELEEFWNSSQKTVKVETPDWSDKYIQNLARKNMNRDACWVCKQCDGQNCASGIPGMGGSGRMESFQDNSLALGEWKIAPRYLSPEGKDCTPDATFTFLGTKLTSPIFIAPVTGSQTNMAGSITEWEYARAIASAARDLGMGVFFGEGATPDKYYTALEAMNIFGTGWPVFKPRANADEIYERLRKTKDQGITAWGMDIDAVSLNTMQKGNQATSRKTPEELKQLASSVSLPFFLKGIMTVQDAGLAGESGAAAIVVSNHGGRIIDSMPGSARVLPAISAFVRKNYPHMQILADGGIRSGSDAFKMLALGADGVAVGRPVAIATVAAGRNGAAAILKRYHDELLRIMGINGLCKTAEINQRYLAQFSR